jgi:uncharacterized protein DUF4124
MRTLILGTLLGLACTSAVSATVYKWVDEKGVVHYSDQPHPSAQQLDVKSAQGYSAGPAPSASAPPGNGAETARVESYTTCELYRPENDEVFMNTDTVVVKLRLAPNLLPGHKVAIGLDGKRQTDQPNTAMDFTLTVERGAHSVIAVVEDQENREICRSSPVTFHVRQPSKQAPNPANRPRF